MEYLDIVKKSKQVKSAKYFKQQLHLIISKLNGGGRTDYISIEELTEELSFIYDDIESYLEDINKDILYLYKSELIDIIHEMNDEINWWKSQERPKEIDRKMYVEKCTSKLNTVFRRQPLLTEDEVTEKIANYDYLNKKYQIFIELLEWINEKGIAVIPDRLLFSAYLGISVNDYQRFLNYQQDKRIQAIFRSIEEYIITSKMNAGEIGSRNNNAIKTNLSYEKVGNNLTPKDNPQNNTTNNLLITNQDIVNKMRKLGYQGQQKNQNVEYEIIDNE